jgi:CheY-like chemotaxis protein
MPARILVVDDEPDVADLVATALQTAGFEVTAVTSGQAALEQLAAQPPYQVVVCDLVMPGVDGIAVYRAVQAAPAPRPAMLFLTGYGDARAREAASQAPEALTLAKPFDITVLRETVARLIAATQ